MARVREQQVTKGEHSGVLIVGRRLRADGSPDTTALQILPERAGMVNGVLYSGAAIHVQPGADGRFEVTLPPSSALGTYTVQLERSALRLVVPDGVERAEFEGCLV